MAKIVILEPQGARTGGPEACYQLSDALLRQGFDAEVWPMAPEDQHAIAVAAERRARFLASTQKVPVRRNPVSDYAHYRSSPYLGEAREASTVFVLPEIFAWAVPFFTGAKVLLWWLSIDNAFSALARVNLNYLRLPNVRHACQSAYAKGVVEALGLSATMLSDYSVVPDAPVPRVDERPMKLCVNAGPKVIANLARLRALMLAQNPSLDFVGIRDLSRDAVYRHFAQARLYVDLGQFPGKDRMVREALLLGANVLVAGAGAGANPVDYPFPDEFRWSLGDLRGLSARLTRMLVDPASFAERLAPARRALQEERVVFDREVAETFRPLAGGGL